MGTYDFDTPVDRRNTDSLKFDRAEKRHRSPDLLSLWVADMDFPAPTAVIQALKERSAHGVFGYTEPGEAYFRALNNWMSQRYGLDFSEKTTVVTPGVVFALAMCVRAFTNPGDAVLIQQPVYYPFAGVVQGNGRVVANASLTYRPDAEGNGYSIDFDAFERMLDDSAAKLFLLCNPHNPAGRVWTCEELARMGSLCASRKVVVVSDEIHMDFARPGFTHVPFATISPELADISLTCTSASKTFNLAGLQVANILITNDKLRKAFVREMLASGYSQPNALGLVATQAAYEWGASWLDDLKSYLEGNWELLESQLVRHAPMLKLVPAQSTYLAWIDCRALGFNAHDLERFIEDEAGLWLDCGHMFGRDGEGFIRINIATQRSYLEKALCQLTSAVKRLDS